MALDRLDQNREHWTRLKTAGLVHREYSLNPSVALFTRGSEAAFSPEDSEAQGLFGSIIGGLDTLDSKEDPEGFHLAYEASGEFAGVVLSVMVFGNESTQPRIECPPLTDGRRRMSHMGQATDFSCGPSAEGCDFGIAPLRQAVGGADEMGQTGLSQIHPLFVNPIAVTHQMPSQSLMSAAKASLDRLG